MKMFVTMYCFRMPYWMRLGVHGIRDWEINWEFQRIINKEKALKYCSKAFSLPKQCQDVEATVVRQWQHCTLQIIRAPWHLSNTICSARKLPELKCSSGLNGSIQVQPPPPCSKFHSLLNYYQVMEWMGCSDEMQPRVWGWKAEGGKLIPVMTDKSSAPNALIQMIHCNCLEGFNTLRCTCKWPMPACTGTL